MPATITTPVNVTGVTYLTPSTAIMPPVASTTAIPVVAPNISGTNVSGVTHYVTRLPIRRWNGTTWVVQYVPRF
jgi:hypothetical protein